MLLGIFRTVMLLGIALSIGCASDDDGTRPAANHGGAAGAGGKSTASNPSVAGSAGEAPILAGSDESWMDLHPAAGIDLTVCATIAATSSSTSTDACADCCTTHSFAVSGFINQGNCTCANPTPPDNTICATKATDGGACLACCTAAGFLIDSWLGNPIPSCTCDAKVDKLACRAATLRSNPAEQCAICCINRGYFNATYTAGNSPECACMPS